MQRDCDNELAARRLLSKCRAAHSTYALLLGAANALESDEERDAAAEQLLVVAQAVEKTLSFADSLVKQFDAAAAAAAAEARDTFAKPLRRKRLGKTDRPRPGEEKAYAARWLKNATDTFARVADWCDVTTVTWRRRPEDLAGRIHVAMPGGVEPTDAELQPVVKAIEHMVAAVTARQARGGSADARGMDDSDSEAGM